MISGQVNKDHGSCIQGCANVADSQQ